MALRLGPGEPSIARGAALREAPRVSVVIPTFTHTWLDDCLDSIRAQTFDNWEIVLVDDGSPEPAAPSRSDDLTLVRQENTRPGGARNRGVSLARGEWIAFLDSDDRWRPEKLERQLAFHEAHPRCLLSTTETCYLTPDGLVEKESLQRSRLTPGIVPYGELFYENFIACSAAMVQREAYLAVGGMAVGRWCEEVDAWLRVGLLGEVGYLGDILVERRHHAASWTRVTSTDGKLLADEESCYEEFFAEHPEQRAKPYARRAMSRLRLHRCFAHLRAGDRAAARRASLEAIRFDPTHRRAWAAWWKSIRPRPPARS